MKKCFQWACIFQAKVSYCICKTSPDSAFLFVFLPYQFLQKQAKHESYFLVHERSSPWLVWNLFERNPDTNYVCAEANQKHMNVISWGQGFCFYNFLSFSFNMRCVTENINFIPFLKREEVNIVFCCRSRSNSVSELHLNMTSTPLKRPQEFQSEGLYDMRQATKVSQQTLWLSVKESYGEEKREKAEVLLQT